MGTRRRIVDAIFTAGVASLGVGVWWLWGVGAVLVAVGLIAVIASVAAYAGGIVNAFDVVAFDREPGNSIDRQEY